MPCRSLLTMASSLESTIEARCSASRCARWTRLRSRAIFEAPMISPAGAPDRRHGQGDRDEGPVLPQPDGFEVIDRPRRAGWRARTWSSSDCRSAGMISADRPADDLGRGVAEQPLGGGVPRHDRPVQILADDRVVARLDDGGEMPGVPLEPAALGDVAGDLRDADNPAVRRHDRRDRQGDVDAAAVLADADGIVVVDALAGAEPAQQDLLFFGVQLGRNDDADRLPDHLSRGVAEHPLGRPIPGGDRRREVFADDGVVGRRDDAGQRERRRSCRALRTSVYPPAPATAPRRRTSDVRSVRLRRTCTHRT